MKKNIFLFLAAVLLLASCDNEPTDRTISVTGVELNESHLPLYVGTAATLRATVRPANADNQTVTWQSSNTAVATVNNGTVAAVASGTAHITVTTQDGGFQASATVTVTTPIVSVTGVELNKAEFELIVNETETLIATVLPENATNRAVTWESGNTQIATVDANGVVRGVRVGTATITATTADGNHQATAEVIVIPRPITVQSVALDRTSATLFVGAIETLTLIATITPNNATNQNVRWSSSDTSVATVDNYGVITAVAVGTATITATTECRERTARSVVTVRTVPPEGVLIGGAIWATSNVNAPGTFAANPEDAGMFYQWGLRTGWSTTDPRRQWDVANNDWRATAHWSSVETNTTIRIWRTWCPCPAGWRVPTLDEFRSLRDAGSEWVTKNGVNGRIFGVAPNQVFLPAAGHRYHVGGGLRSVDGHYWSDTARSETHAWEVSFWNIGVRVASSAVHRRNGFNVRCVAE